MSEQRGYKKLLKLTEVDQITGYRLKYDIKNPYFIPIRYNGKDYAFRYYGKKARLELINDTQYETKLFYEIECKKNQVINISIDPKGKMKISPFNYATGLFSYFWNIDCWSRSRLVYEEDKYLKILNSLGNNRLTFESDSVNAVYELNHNFKMLRRCIYQKKATMRPEDVINICREIVKSKNIMDSEDNQIGWNVDYMSMENNIKYDIFLDQPYHNSLRTSELRKDAYLKFLDGGKRVDLITPSKDCILSCR